MLEHEKCRSELHDIRVPLHVYNGSEATCVRCPSFQTNAVEQLEDSKYDAICAFTSTTISHDGTVFMRPTNCPVKPFTSPHCETTDANAETIEEHYPNLKNAVRAKGSIISSLE